MGDHVAGLHARARRRRIVDRRYDLHQAVLHRDFDAQPAELAAGLHLHVAVGLLVHEAGMRIQRCQHAVDRGFDQLAVIDRLHIVRPHPVEHVAEQIQLAIGFAGRRLGRCAGQEDQRGTGRQSESRHTTEQKIAHQPLTFLALAVSQGTGFTGSPRCRTSTYRIGRSPSPFPTRPTGSPADTACPTLASMCSKPASRE